jgi:hypothetical protein
MSLREFASKGWLRPHKTSKQEIADLLTIVDRDLRDATAEISADWRFGIAYNAALKLCSILLHAEGYRAGQGSHHMRTIATLPLNLQKRTKADADYLDACRRKRNIVEYDRAGGATDSEADELIEFVQELRKDVLSWLRTNHPNLV